METKYEPIKFDSWQELAKYVIDGGDVYVDCQWRIKFSGVGFNCDIKIIFSNKNLYIKKQPTLEELIAIKPRLCWVWDYPDESKRVRVIDHCKGGLYYGGGFNSGMWWKNAQKLTDDEIKQFLSGEQ